MEQGKDRLQLLIKQAASVHVLNAVYFLAMIVLTGLALNVASPKDINEVSGAIWQTITILSLTLIFKCVVHYYERLQQNIPIEQFELLITVCNVAATFSLLGAFTERTGEASSITLPLLNSFMPGLLLVLITPITWRKPKDVKHYGFFGFLEWALLIVVFSWSFSIIVKLVNTHSWLSISTNLVVLAGPLFLGWMRKRYMSRMLSRMHEEIYLDPLTKIPNRKAYYDFYDEWRSRVSKKQASKDGLMVLLCDVDHFKAYNDHYGHDVGDTCLREVALWLTSLCQPFPDAEIFRYGGEEFVILLPINKNEVDNVVSSDGFFEWHKGEARMLTPHARSPFEFVTLSGCLKHVSNNFIYTNNALGVIGLVDHQLYKAKEKRAILVVDH